MKAEQIDRILDTIQGVRKDGAAWIIPDGCEVSLHISLPSEVLAVPKVQRVERAGDVTIAEGHGGERFYFSTDGVELVKVVWPDRGKAGRNAGFR